MSFFSRSPRVISLRPYREYEECSSVCVPWFMFGTSGHETPPPGLVIEHYTERARFPPPLQRKKLLKWKSVVQPSAVVAVGSVHMFDLIGGVTGGVDERNVRVTPDGAAQSPAGSVLRINHYYTRSHQEFVAKLDTVRFTTARASHRAHPHPHNRQRLREMIEEEIVHDETILRFLPALRRRVGLKLANPSCSRRPTGEL